MVINRKQIFSSILGGLLLLILPVTAYAHVIVTPGQAGVGQELVFNISIPNERQVAVTGLKLLIPDGVSDVIPTSQAGWTITTTTGTPNDSTDGPTTTAINWSGTIPVGQRQDFSFSAQVPGQATELDWKAYQSYADGTVVHWDQKPTGSDDANGNAGPYSVTHVINDLTGTTPNKSTNTSQAGPYILAGLALLLSAVALTSKRK
jgi:uncharacterized protein YcnI